VRRRPAESSKSLHAKNRARLMRKYQSIDTRSYCQLGFTAAKSQLAPSTARVCAITLTIYDTSHPNPMVMKEIARELFLLLLSPSLSSFPRSLSSSF
jgi:hypothetical protein